MVDYTKLCDPKLLVDFWPADGMSDEDKMFAYIRFIIYSTVLIYALNRDQRIFPIATISIGVLVFSFKRQDQANYVEDLKSCKPATYENPAGNRLIAPGYLGSQASCGRNAELVEAHQIMEPQQALYGGEFLRQFMPTPMSTKNFAGGQKRFAEFLGQPNPPNKPFCKDTNSLCVPSFTGR